MHFCCGKRTAVLVAKKIAERRLRLRGNHLTTFPPDSLRYCGEINIALV